MIYNFFKNYILDFIANKRGDGFRQKNALVLASCYLFVIPFFFILTTKLVERKFLLFIAGLQIFLSIGGDYYFVEDPKFGRKITMIDRNCAMIYALYLIYFVISGNILFSLFGGITSIFFIEYSRMSPTFEVWVNRHALWHVVCNSLLLVFLNILRKKDESKEKLISVD